MSTKNELIVAAGKIDEISRRASAAFLGAESFEKALVGRWRTFWKIKS
jgi:hypothetical protein